MKIFSPLATLLMLASLTGFQAQAGSRQVIDANGQSQSVPDAPRRGLAGLALGRVAAPCGRAPDRTDVGASRTQAGMARDTGHTQPGLTVEVPIDRPTATNRRRRARRVLVLALKVVVPRPVPGGAALALREAELAQRVVQTTEVGLQVPIRRPHVCIVAADHAAGMRDDPIDRGR